MKEMSLREAIHLWRRHDPHVSATDLAAAFKVSPQRVRQILEEDGLPTVTEKRPPKRPAALAGVRIIRRPGRPTKS